MRQRILILVLLFPFTSTAGIYKCVVDGHTEFSQRPCGENAKEITVNTKKPSLSPRAPSQRAEEMNAVGDEFEQDRKRRNLEREQRVLLKDIDRFNSQRDRELKRLEAKKLLANNNSAGAAWEQSISTEMQSVNMKYDAKIQAAQIKLKAVSDKLSRLE